MANDKRETADARRGSSSVIYLVLTCILCLTLASIAHSDKGDLMSLPEGSSGIASRYAGDVGIAEDPAVLFAEDFETGSVDSIRERWGHSKSPEVLELSPIVPASSGGNRSMQMTGTLGENSGGDLYTTFKGVDTAYLRFYTKFAADHVYEHHFVCLGGYNPPTPYPSPHAGSRPNGDDRVMVSIDPIGHRGSFSPPGVWGLYSYWPEMKISADDNYWGNVLSPVEHVPIPRDEWICVELMIKLNSAPDVRDGELALWIDGKQVNHFAAGMQRGPWTGMGLQLLESGGEPFEGLLLRTSMELKINHIWLEHYIDPGAQRQNRLENPNPINTVWFDDVVVATEYIGPLTP